MKKIFEIEFYQFLGFGVLCMSTGIFVAWILLHGSSDSGTITEFPEDDE